MNSDHQKRNTKQKKAIENVFHEINRPLSMLEVLEAGRAFSPTLNRATVYRNLKILVEEGWLTKVQLPSSGIFYKRSNKQPHHHFLCRLCNKAFDLLGSIIRPNQNIAPSGFVVENHDLIVHGVCSTCTKD